MFEWLGPYLSLPLGLLLSAFFTLPLVNTRQAPGWWCLERGVKSERTSPLLRIHAQQKWSEDASFLSFNSPARKPFSTSSSSYSTARNSPGPWLTGGTCAAGARPARGRREEAPEIRITDTSIAYLWRATRRYGCADKWTLPLHDGPPAACMLHSIRDLQR